MISAWDITSRLISAAIESALKDKTSHLAEVPSELSEWSGRTEIRRMSEEQIKGDAEFYIDQYQELGLWDFLCTHVQIPKSLFKVVDQKRVENPSAYDW